MIWWKSPSFIKIYFACEWHIIKISGRSKEKFCLSADNRKRGPRTERFLPKYRKNRKKVLWQKGALLAERACFGIVTVIKKLQKYCRKRPLSAERDLFLPKAHLSADSVFLPNYRKTLKTESITAEISADTFGRKTTERPFWSPTNKYCYWNISFRMILM